MPYQIVEGRVRLHYRERDSVLRMVGIALLAWFLMTSQSQAYPGDVFASKQPAPKTPTQPSLTVDLGQYDLASITGGAEYSIPM
ncbi:MAG: hypothetical protein GKR90_08625 [Pseudomonadales bacterium]|nr:hypothetical protein [Pseudomonadales bacterium]